MYKAPFQSKDTIPGYKDPPHQDKTVVRPSFLVVVGTPIMILKNV